MWQLLTEDGRPNDSIPRPLHGTSEIARIDALNASIWTTGAFRVAHVLVMRGRADS